MQAGQRPNTIKFGTFELDLRARELRKHGLKIRLPEQSIQILAMLLEHPGEVVTREDVRRRLWPDDTVVEFDDSINSAVRRLRQALDDSAEKPRYIETLARRGYRFIAPAQQAPQPTGDTPTGRGELPVARVDLGARQGHPPAVPLQEPAGEIREPSKAPQTQRRGLRYVLALRLAGMAAMLLVGTAVAWLVWHRIEPQTPQVAPGTVHSLAVLPLENLSGDPRQEYFADGMTEALITELGQIAALGVISRTSAMAYKGSKKTLPQIARELGVDAVVEGSVEREGNRARITAQLVEAKTDRHLWAHTYDSDLTSVLKLQGEVAHAIADEIKIRVTPQEQARLARARPVNPEAHELYLQGRYISNGGGSESEAIGFFQKAIEKDPSYAPAYAALAASYDHSGQGGSLPYFEAYSGAKAAASKAIELDDNLAEAHAGLAYALIDLDWDWATAEKELRRALELNPNSAPVHAVYTLYLARVGRPSEAISEAQRLLQLDPVSLGAYHYAAYTYYAARQYDRALDQIRKASELNLVSSDSWIHWTLGIIYRDKGMYDRAIKEFTILGDPPHVLGHMGNAYARAGKVAEARETISKLKDHVEKDGVGTYEIALVHAGLGEKEEAFAWLERSYKVRDKGLTYLKIDPCLDPLRSDPRFQDLERRVGLTP